MRATNVAALVAVLVLAGCSELLADFTFHGPDAGGQQDAGSLDGGSDASPDDAGGDAGCVTRCDGECTDTRSDPQHCGSCTRSCSAPPNGRAACDEGACGFVCDPGYAASVGMCVALPAPRQVAPLSTATATSRRPTLRWELGPRTTGARIEVCADRACAVVLQTIDAAGSSGAPATDLPSGIVFWRLFGRSDTDVGLEPSSTWQLHVGVRSASIDASWGTNLDVNGDGFADTVIGARGVDSNRGRAYVHHGSAAGLVAAPIATLIGPDAAGFFGEAIASAGDVNGDGFADVVIGASSAGLGGRAYVYLGGSAGLEDTPSTMLTGPDGSGGEFGFTVASAGDVNGDGFADVVVGAPSAASRTGRVHLYLGGPSGLGTAPAATLTGPDGAEGKFGFDVAEAGDVNGDGFADVIVGAPSVSSGAGRAYLFLGSATGLAAAPTRTLMGPSGGEFGRAVGSAGDVNGDGYADVVVGAWAVSSYAGALYLYVGSATGLGTSPAQTLTGPDGPNGFFGVDVASADDVNGDGFGDLLVSAWGASSNVGRVHLYVGSASGLGTSPRTTLTGPDGGQFGRAMSAADINGDGFADAVIGAWAVDAYEGRAYVHLGSAGGLSASPARTLRGLDGTGAFFGISVASALTPRWRHVSVHMDLKT